MTKMIRISVPGMLKGLNRDERLVFDVLLKPKSVIVCRKERADGQKR